MRKKLLLTMLSGMLTIGFLGACGNVEDLNDGNLNNDPVENDGMNDDMNNDV